MAAAKTAEVSYTLFDIDKGIQFFIEWTEGVDGQNRTLHVHHVPFDNIVKKTGMKHEICHEHSLGYFEKEAL